MEIYNLNIPAYYPLKVNRSKLRSKCYFGAKNGD